MSRRFGEQLSIIGQQARYNQCSVGSVSSTSGGGKHICVSNTKDSELSNFMNITPYGFSSAPTSGCMAFTIVSNGKTGMVGVFDKGKPSVASGCCMMYSSGGATVYCKDDKVLINDIDILEEIYNIKKRLKSHNI